jgi:hypothetical protein
MPLYLFISTTWAFYQYTIWDYEYQYTIWAYKYQYTIWAYKYMPLYLFISTTWAFYQYTIWASCYFLFINLKRMSGASSFCFQLPQVILYSSAELSLKLGPMLP